MNIRIYYDSTDAGKIVYHTEYIKFCEQARSEIFFKNGIIFEKEGYVVKHLEANYLASAKLGDIITVKTKVVEISKVKLTLKQTIYKENKKLFEMEVTLVYIKDSKISKIPPSHIDILNEYA